MVLLDVKVLMYAHLQDTPHHRQYLAWLENLINSDHAYGLSDLVLNGFLRIVTHLGVFNPPSSMEKAFTFVEDLRNQQTCTVINPGPRHWEIFCRLCKAAGIKGNLIPDAFLAALAIESDNEWIAADRDYHRFSGLRVRHPIH